jgi:predicted ribosomally synthesized peptide with SipW-like signal peptide
MLVTILTFSMLVIVASAGTFAYFQDTASGAAKITTGNPDLVTVFNGNAYDILGDIYLPHLVPGDYGYMDLGKIQNRGSAGGNLFIKVDPIAGVADDLHLYACDVNGNPLGSVDLAHGGEVKVGSMAAKVGSVNAEFPMKIYFSYTETGNLQTGNGVSYNFPITVSLRSTGQNLQTINVPNNYYATN